MMDDETPDAHSTSLESVMPPFEDVAELATDPHGPFNNLPGWSKVVGYVGFPVVVTGVLLWMFVGQLNTNGPILLQNQQLMKNHNTISYQQYINRLNVDAAMLRTLSQICANGAKTSAERKECAVAVIPLPPPLNPDDTP